jgi:hypothetical protein
MPAVDKVPPQRILALRRFGIAITILTILGHTVLGFEQSLAQPLCSLLTTYSVELIIEYCGARSQRKTPAFLGGGRTGFVNFLLPAHISGLAIGMLLYASDRILPFVCAAAVAICSKALFRVPTANGPRHFLNPSNFGITVTLLMFPSVGIAPPYMFTEGLGRAAAVLLPLLIVCTGLMLNVTLTRRLPLILAWLGSFAVQAFLRTFTGDALLPILNAMTGVAFILFTFYMITDPATTPSQPKRQLLFGLGVGIAYGVLVVFHVVFGLFFGLTLVCILRGGLITLGYLLSRTELPVRPIEDPFKPGVVPCPAKAPEPTYSVALPVRGRGGHL